MSAAVGQGWWDEVEAEAAGLVIEVSLCGRSEGEGADGWVEDEVEGVVGDGGEVYAGEGEG